VAAHFAGSFSVPYYISAAFDLTAAALALFVLRPVIRRRIAGEAVGQAKGAAIGTVAGATR
jgi:hypothetical protein